MAINPQAKNFEQLAGATRYYRWFYDVVSPWVGRRILDIGCGYGNVIKNFLDREFVLGIDIDPEYITHIRSRFSGKKNFRAELLDISNLGARETLKSSRFDTAIGFNVFEHIADDQAAMRAVYEILEPRGHVVMLVPAFKALTSPYDTAVGHYRRYTKKSASDLVERSGFRVVEARYFNALGALAWLWTYRLLQKDEPGRGSVKLLEALVPLLKYFEALVRVPFGISVITIGRKE